MRLSHSTLYAISGAVWMIIGVFLLNLGLQLMMQGAKGEAFSLEGYSPLFVWLSTLFSGFENAIIVLIILSIVVGFFKGRFVLRKVAARTHQRLQAFENPTSIANVYTKANYAVIIGMMMLGMAMRYFNIPNDIRGPIDIAVGTALMQGAIAYFHLSSQARQDYL
jgi:hypothetical protein